MTADGTDRVEGWLKYAGHRWPVDRLELRNGVLRITISGMAVTDVPAGVTSGELYGTDGALVFRADGMEHTDIHAGEIGSLSMNFFLPRLDDDDMDEDAVSVAIDQFMEEQDKTGPATMTQLLCHARTAWVRWRTTGFVLTGYTLGMLAYVLHAPPWLAVAAASAGMSVAVAYDRLIERDWWNK